MFEHITHEGYVYTARTGVPFPRPIPTRDQFDATWKFACVVPPNGMCRPPRRRVVVGICGRAHNTYNTCNPGQPCASPLTGPAPSPLWCRLTILVRPWQLVAAIGGAIEPWDKGEESPPSYGSSAWPLQGTRIWLPWAKFGLRCYRFVVCIFVLICCS